MLETYDPQEFYDPDEAYEPQPRHLDVLGLTALGLIIFIIFTIFKDGLDTRTRPVSAAPASLEQPASLDASLDAGLGGEALPFSPEEMAAFSAPYMEYVITQGLHGYDYGHAAIDLAAGKGEAVLSPINGYVADLYVDQYGNPTLVLENDFYQVTLLHGKYSVDLGQIVTAGQQVGAESNKGYTTDMAGRSCAGRDCGYHTHINVFDKTLGVNVNPLDLIEP